MSVKILLVVGIPAREAVAVLDLHDVAIAAAVAREADNTIGNGSRGPVTEKLQTMYFDLVHGRLDIHPVVGSLVADLVLGDHALVGADALCLLKAGKKCGKTR